MTKIYLTNGWQVWGIREIEADVQPNRLPTWQSKVIDGKTRKTIKTETVTYHGKWFTDRDKAVKHVQKSAKRMISSRQDKIAQLAIEIANLEKQVANL